MAHRTAAGLGHDEILPDCHRDVRQWPLVVAEQHPRPISRTSLSGDDDPRQCRGRTYTPDPTPGDHPSPGRDRLLDGRAAGVPVGRELSDVHGSHRRHVRYGQRPMAMASCGWRARSQPSRPTARSVAVTIRRSRSVACGRLEQCGLGGCTHRNGGGARCGA